MVTHVAGHRLNAQTVPEPGVGTPAPVDRAEPETVRGDA
jgi:hypothetical protein